MVVLIPVLCRNVNPNTLGKDGWSPLEIAVQTGIIETVQLILQDKRLELKSEPSSRGSALHIAASAGNFKMANLLLFKAPFLVTVKDASDKTPLEVATN